MLKQRIITGVLLATVFFCSLLFKPLFVSLISLILLVGAWEWAGLADLRQPAHRLLYVCITALLLLLVSFIANISPQLTMDVEVIRYLLLISVSWWALSLLWIQGYPSSAVLWGNRWVLALMGWVVLIPGWVALVYLQGHPKGNGLILLVVAIVITADVGAYFLGKMLGRRKLAPIISPGKSWEGFWGGLIACMLLGLLVAWAVDFSQWISLLAVIILVALASIVGDLVESMVKRHRGVKDSGNILPGHGGVLDRIDSLMAAVPVFTLVIITADWKI